MNTIFLILGAVVALLWSFKNDKGKTIQGIKMAKGMFLQTAGDITGVLSLVGLLLAIIPNSLIQSLLGGSNAFSSAVYGALIGTVTILPAFIAFPLAESLLSSGANLIAIAALITTLTMVGFATYPIEVDYFGKKFAIVRNSLSFLFALLIAGGMVIVL
ncbi:permease [Halanaerobaculum tunisiense]